MSKLSEEMKQHEQECPFIQMTKVISYVVVGISVVLLGMIMYHGVILGGFTNNLSM